VPRRPTNSGRALLFSARADRKAKERAESSSQKCQHERATVRTRCRETALAKRRTIPGPAWWGRMMNRHVRTPLPSLLFPDGSFVFALTHRLGCGGRNHGVRRTAPGRGRHGTDRFGNDKEKSRRRRALTRCTSLPSHSRRGPATSGACSGSGSGEFDVMVLRCSVFTVRYCYRGMQSKSCRNQGQQLDLTLK
jgi:hypothetical protein